MQCDRSRTHLIALGRGSIEQNSDNFAIRVGIKRVPVRHLSSSSLLECRPYELARGHFGGGSEYSVAIKRFVYFYLLVELQNYDV